MNSPVTKMYMPHAIAMALVVVVMTACTSLGEARVAALRPVEEAPFGVVLYDQAAIAERFGKKLVSNPYLYRPSAVGLIAGKYVVLGLEPRSAAVEVVDFECLDDDGDVIDSVKPLSLNALEIEMEYRAESMSESDRTGLELLYKTYLFACEKGKKGWILQDERFVVLSDPGKFEDAVTINVIVLEDGKKRGYVFEIPELED